MGWEEKRRQVFKAIICVLVTFQKPNCPSKALENRPCILEEIGSKWLTPTAEMLGFFCFFFKLKFDTPALERTPCACSSKNNGNYLTTM